MKWQRILFVLIIISTLIFIYNYIQISKVYINKVKLNTGKINKKIKIAQISDYHNNKYINKSKLLKKIEEFNPDIIVLTGDIIDFKTIDTEPTLKLLEDMLKINKNIYFVSGNHEMRNLLYKEFLKDIEDLGIKVLDNNKTIVNINDEEINLLGLSFYSTKEDYNRVIKGIDNKKYTILLSHSPNRPLSFLSGNEDLILSGHTHGGQVRLPIIGGLIAPGQGLKPKYDKGIYEIRNTILYIDSGLGNSVYPIRSFNRVQISNITIEEKE